MDALTEAKIVKIVSPFQFVLQNQDQSTIQIEVAPSSNRHYQHLLPRLAHETVKY